MTDREFWEDAYREDPDDAIVEDLILDEEVEGLAVGAALDLGCGSGPNALKLAATGWSVVGVDWSEQAIKLARESAAELGFDATFVLGDITSWEPPQLFDLVISTYALPGGRDSELALQTAANALAEGGTLIVAEWDRSMSEVWGFEADELMTPEQIAAQLPGLEIEAAEVRQMQGMFPSPEDPRGRGNADTNVAFVRARKR